MYSKRKETNNKKKNKEEEGEEEKEKKNERSKTCMYNYVEQCIINITKQCKGHS